MTPADKPLPPFPDYSQPGITNNLLAERDYWESRCRLAVRLLKRAQGYCWKSSSDNPSDDIAKALAAIGALPEREGEGR
jgi:hypothetical protein